MTNTRLILLSVANALSSALAIAQTPAQMLKEVEREARRTDSAFQAISATRGESFFRTPHGGEWSCASCQEHDEVATPHLEAACRQEQSQLWGLPHAGGAGGLQRSLAARAQMRGDE